jgi:hypothetical protein
MNEERLDHARISPVREREIKKREREGERVRKRERERERVTSALAPFICLKSE